MKAVTAAQVRDVEQAAVAAGVSLDTLMENAGLAVANAAANFLGGAAGRRAVVLVGPGNNGGDGLVAARHLAKMLAKAECWVLLPRKSPDPKRAPAEAAGASVMDIAECGGLPALAASVHDADVVLDAVLGIGQGRAIGEPLAGVFRAVRHSGKPVLAVDLPTGTNSDSGVFDPNGLPATVTYMLGLPKLGPVIRPVESRCGKLEVLDIGLPDGVDDGINIEWLTPSLAKSLLPARPAGGHKGTFGRALIIGGSKDYIGAVTLAAQAAGRTGAGLVEVAAPESVHRAVAAQAMEPIHRPLPVSTDGALDPIGAGRGILAAANDASAVLVGPGLGQSPVTGQLVRDFLAAKREALPTVVDADGLNALAGSHRWWERVRGPCVLTPHPGEMARLTGKSVAQVQPDRLGLARSAAKEWGKVVVLKGAATVIASPGGRARISPWVNSGLAKGGTGDVLAGVVAGLLAQKPGDAFDMASLAVYLHGQAGDIACKRKGESGMTAGDVVEALPDAFIAAAAG